ncbi:hypothetical protein D9M73_103460 [compost metagenome]
MSNPFTWRGQPSTTGKDLGRTQRAPKTPPTPLTFTKKPTHPLRNSEAQKVGSTSRAPTSSINTERPKVVRTKGAAI